MWFGELGGLGGLGGLAISVGACHVVIRGAWLGFDVVTTISVVVVATELSQLRLESMDSSVLGLEGGGIEDALLKRNSDRSPRRGSRISTGVTFSIASEKRLQEHEMLQKGLHAPDRTAAKAGAEDRRSNDASA